MAAAVFFNIIFVSQSTASGMSTTTTGQYIQQLKQLEYESDKLYYLASIVVVIE